ASLDPVLVIGDSRVRLATHEWSSGAVAPEGYAHLSGFELRDAVPQWRFCVGDICLEIELAMQRGRAGVGVVHRLLRSDRPVRLEVEALCTWRDAHGERTAGSGDPEIAVASDGFVFENRYRVLGPGFRPAGEWYRDVHYRVEAERGLEATEDLWFAGTFSAELAPGDTLEVLAFAGDLGTPPPAPAQLVASTRARVAALGQRVAGGSDDARRLAVAADQFIVEGPTVVAGYPWFGDWSRDTMTSYEGLFLCTGRFDEGRELLLAAAGTISEGMLANTADVGGTQYNTVDATLWLFQAIHRHVTVTGDVDLFARVSASLSDVVAAHVEGTRYGIHVDGDGLLAWGAPDVALTWMDARIDDVPVTPRIGKPVEVNALWVNALACFADLIHRTRGDAWDVSALEDKARASFAARFRKPDGGLFDVVDGPSGDDASNRPNQLLAVSLPFAALRDRGPVDACARLVSPLGLRSLDPKDAAYRPLHRGSQEARDAAYHQGTVWPWLIGSYVEARWRVGLPVDGLLDGLLSHVADWGVGSVSETADGDAPHAATGCPMQAWSVAELLRSVTLLGSGRVS
ncbi:MAG TPA: amylo-alpha-1,6-glucosidase, partial [Acidimicrobiales bacterium]|nr:amylo-alpha-1,6-glucosidase [Acidimicrobiales bacterium]